MSKPVLVKVFREDLQCYVRMITYNLEAHIGGLLMPDGNCCDMGGCIRLFKAIDPDVQIIETFSGDKPDTSYRRRDGKWQAISPDDQAGEFYEIT